MTPLTPHFSLEELTFSETATRLGINNTPNPGVVANLTLTAQGLEQVRELLNSNAIRISSGYRCEVLEKVICEKAYKKWCTNHSKIINDQSWAEYFALKSHSKGEAADFTCPTQGTPEQIVRRIRDSRIDYDQLICEFSSWVHISFSDHPRRQTLTIDKDGVRSFI